MGAFSKPPPWYAYVFRLDVDIPQQGYPIRSHVDNAQIGTVFRVGDGRIVAVIDEGVSPPKNLRYRGDHFTRARTSDHLIYR